MPKENWGGLLPQDGLARAEECNQLSAQAEEDRSRMVREAQGRMFAARRRKLTVVAQLSEDGDYEGGALEVNGDGAPRVASRAQGGGIAFPSFALHRVAPVTRGRRWSLTIWAHGAPFR